MSFDLDQDVLRDSLLMFVLQERFCTHVEENFDYLDMTSSDSTLALNQFSLRKTKPLPTCKGECPESLDMSLTEACPLSKR